MDKSRSNPVPARDEPDDPSGETPATGARPPKAGKSAEKARKSPGSDAPSGRPGRPGREADAAVAAGLWPLLDEHGSDIIFRISSDGKLISLSGAAKRALGPDVDRAIGRPFLDLLHDPDPERWRTFLDKGGGPPLRAVLAPPSGRRATYDLFCRPAPAGDPAGWVGLARRVTGADEPPAEARLAAGLAHELNQPLTAIGTTARAGARLLRAGDAETDELTDAFDQIARQADRAAEIIRRMRDLMTREKRHRARADLNQLAREAVRLFAPDLKANKIKARLDLDPKLPTVVVDEVQMSQVLVNLVRNALEALTQAPVSQRVLTVTTRREKQAVTVAVSDRGPGLSVDVVNRLFEPFVTTKPQGMGVGLALSRTFVEAHGGQVHARPNPDRGITFTVTLPLTPEHP